MGAHGVRGFDLGLGVREAAEADLLRPPAAPRQVRQRFDRGLRPAELVDQGAERGGADILAADQPQPGETLGVIEACAGLRLFVSRQYASPRRS
jgi:hypothetical protein